MDSPRRFSLLALPLALALAACPGGHGAPPDAIEGDDAPPDATPFDAPPPDALVRPAFRNPVATGDDALAMQALQLLGAEVSGADTNCDVCHGLTRARFHTWKDLSDTAMSSCLTNLTVEDATEARAMIACLRETPSDETSPFTPAHLGIYATAVGLPWFDYLFELAYPGEGAAKQEELIDRAQMPRGSHPPFDQGEFDIIAEWVARGMPLVDTLVPEPPQDECVASIGPEVAAHITAMANSGWTAVNAADGINMLGCAGATTARECLTTFTRASTTTYGATWEQDLPGSVQRVLYDMNYNSSYWTRSSADGRFVAHGGGSSAGGGSTIIDLATPGRLIGTAGFYDPGFFPDNSGFIFQGGGAQVCDQRLLSNTPFDNYVDYSEAACNQASSVALYQHLGATPGGDYWIVNSQWVGDNGGWGSQGDPYPGFDGSATVRLIPLVHNGVSYDERPTITKQTPYEGDIVLSPAAGMLISRVAGTNSQAGYRLRQVNATPVGDTYSIEIPVIGTYCIDGAKPAISYDERWLVLHHYVTDADAVELGFTGPNDPAFQPYRNLGAANLYLVDLLSGDQTRITRMGPGQFALFPHFRSDGWIYFNARTGGGEYIVASDAALLVAGQ
jgi:hypothetical protein